MYGIHAMNVNEALPIAMTILGQQGVSSDSRNGPVRRMTGPVTTTYVNPREKVLFDPERHANPFFHFFEALWILAGRADVASLAEFNSQIALYSDDGIVFHAPYGHRLRYAHGMDQLQICVDMLRKDPTTRRAVMSIWDPRQDLGAFSKDLPCNDTIMFSVNNGLLSMTVCCRSNDAIWGAYGANVVQFSTMLEYVAARAGLGVGRYYQMSNDFHVYESNPYWQHVKEHGSFTINPYQDGTMRATLSSVLGVTPEQKPVTPYDLFSEPETESDLTMWFSSYADRFKMRSEAFTDVVWPLYASWQAHKKRNYEKALELSSMCAAEDWRLACMLWLVRTERKWKEAQ